MDRLEKYFVIVVYDKKSSDRLTNHLEGSVDHSSKNIGHFGCCKLLKWRIKIEAGEIDCQLMPSLDFSNL